jgi:phosphoglycolate phosphatase
MEKYKHIIWDWNGTLFDDAHLCVEILNESLAKREMPTITVQQYQKEFGFPVKDFYEKRGFDFSNESYDAVAKEYIEEYNKRRFECELREGALKVLRSCKDEGLSQSILSAYQQDMLQEAVEYFGIRGFFTKLFGLNDYYASCKVAHGRELIEELGLSPEKVLMIGDTIHDFEVAKEIGCDCVLIPSGHQFRDRLLSCGVDVMDSLAEVVKLFSRAGS